MERARVVRRVMHHHEIKPMVTTKVQSCSPFIPMCFRIDLLHLFEDLNKAAREEVFLLTKLSAVPAYQFLR